MVAYSCSDLIHMTYVKFILSLKHYFDFPAVAMSTNGRTAEEIQKESHILDREKAKANPKEYFIEWVKDGKYEQVGVYIPQVTVSACRRVYMSGPEDRICPLYHRHAVQLRGSQSRGP